MKLLEKIAFFLLPLSILFSSLNFIPNRILIISLLFVVFIRKGFFLGLLIKKKWIIVISLLYLLLILFGNRYLSKEAILFLTFPIYLIIYRQSSLSKFLLKKYFILAVLFYSVLLLLFKTIYIISFGFFNFIEQEQWWNQILYKNLTSDLHAHPTYVAMFIIASIVMLLGQSFKEKKYFSPVKSIIIQALFLLVLILLVVKISFVTIILILATYIIFLIFNKQLMTAAKGLILLLLIGLAIFQIPGVKQRLLNDVQPFQNSHLNVNKENKLLERTALWKASFNDISKHPIAGTSFRGISSKSSIYKEAKSLYPQLQKEKNCHNNFLECGVRYGILGIILFSLMTIFLFIIGLKQGSFEIIGIWILLFLFSLTESFLFREQGISIVAILIAIFGTRLYERDI